MTNLFLSKDFVHAMKTDSWKIEDYHWPLMGDRHLIVFMPPPNDDWAVCLLPSNKQGFATGVLFLPSKKKLLFRADNAGFYPANGKEQISDRACRSVIGTAIASICKINAGFAKIMQKKPFDSLQSENSAAKRIKSIAGEIGDEKPSNSYHIVALGRTNYIPAGKSTCRKIERRFHERRGHWRYFKNGKKCWVKPHYCGSKSKGTIHKDYTTQDFLGADL